jgi:hypothetical protein
MNHLNKSLLLFPAVAFIPFLLSSCSPLPVSTINCENTSIVTNFQDGSSVSTPQSALGKEDFTWFRKENKVEVKVMGSFDAQGNYKEKVQKVPAILKNNILSFSTKPSSIMPSISYVIDLKSETYSSNYLSWESSSDGSYKIAVKGTCLL